MEVIVIIPALNEERSIGKVINEIPDFVKQIIVVDNGSSDQTSQVALTNGATTLSEPVGGYGKACLAGLDYLATKSPPDVVVFLDGDYADYPDQMDELLEPIKNGFDMVIGSRVLGKREKGSMTAPQVFGNWLATRLIKIFYGVKFTDLGPFRAIRYEALMGLQMADQNYGWTVEMQLKAAKNGLKCTEVPVNYRNRIGYSKVSGTVKGTVMAGYKILWTIFKYL